MVKSSEKSLEKLSDKAFKMLFKVACFLLPILLSYIIIKNNKTISELTILSDEFMINFLGAVLGLGITILALIFSSIDKLRVEISKLNNATSNPVNIESNEKRLFKSLKEDTFTILYFFIGAFLLSILKGLDIPILAWQLNILTKIEFILMLKLYLMMLTFILIGDIIASLFGLLQANEELVKRGNKIIEMSDIKKKLLQK
jgi:hypothetical protein